MKKTTFLTIVMSAMTILYAQAQQPTAAKSPLQMQMERKVANIQSDIAALSLLLADTTKQSGKFTPELLDSVYAIQRAMEELSYELYDRTDYPIEELPPMDDEKPTIDEPMADTSITPDYPSFPAPNTNPWGMFKKPKSPRTILRVAFNWGLSDLAEYGTRTQNIVYPTFDYDQSRNRSWQLMFETRLGNRDTLSFSSGRFNPKKPWKRDDQFKENKWSLRYGIAVEQYRMDEIGSNQIEIQNNQTVFTPLGNNAKSNTIKANYLTFPVVLQAKFAKNMQIQAGLFGSLLTSSVQEITYKEGSFEFERRRKDNYGITKFNYGVQFGLGFDTLFFTGRFSLSPFFDNNDNYHYRLFSYGITVSL